MVLAVIDTNVIVSALLTKNNNSPTLKVLQLVFAGTIVPLINNEIITEYCEVLIRPKFNLSAEIIEKIVHFFRIFGIETKRKDTGENLPDPDDLVFYEIVEAKRNENAYLVTGNIKHYPSKCYIVTPSEMINILEKNTSE